MPRKAPIDPRWGITAVRVAMGLILAHAGAQKLAAGVGQTAANFARWDVPLPLVSAYLVTGLELFGGALLVVGVLTRWLGLAFAVQFAVATFWVKYRLMGWEFGRVDLMLLTTGILLFLNGPGRAAIDRD
jgi:putative oxidoreductase